MNTLFCSIGDWALDVVRKEQLGKSDSQGQANFCAGAGLQTCRIEP